MSDRYDAGASQGAYEPGSHDQVLRNKLGVTNADEMAQVELLLLEKL